MADSPIVVTFRFYEELNDFLPPAWRKQAFDRHCPPGATTKHMIEALGVPHTEVELVLVNGESVGFDRMLADGDRVAVYPVFEALDVAPLLRLRERPLRDTRFVADAHLGGLAHLLRLFGFDTLFDNHYPDDEIVQLAAGQGRIVLTRDRGLLKRREITHGCYVRALHREQQLREVFDRLDLARSAQPFTRCLRCNALLRAVDKAAVIDRLPPGIQAKHDRFAACGGCDRVYWEGSHWRRMSGLVEAVLGAAAIPAVPHILAEPVHGLEPGGSTRRGQSRPLGINEEGDRHEQHSSMVDRAGDGPGRTGLAGRRPERRPVGRQDDRDDPSR